MVPQSPQERALWITYLNVALYALCYQLQRPIEPFLVDALSEDGDDVAQIYGRIQAFFSFVQTLGSPLVGMMLDRIGIRKTSAVVFLASALSYGILAAATDLNLLLLSKIPTAFQAAFLVAQATAATLTGNDTAARAAALGRMTTAYTVGATIGPTLGGVLARSGNFYVSARYAVFGSVLSAVLSLLFLPDDNGSAAKNGAVPAEPKSNQQHEGPPVSAITRSLKLLVRQGLWPLLLVKVMGGISSSIHSTTWPLVLKQRLSFDPSDIGLFMSTSMLAVAAFGAFGMAPLTNWLGSKNMSLLGLSGRAIVGTLFALIISASSNKDAVLVYILVSVNVCHSLLTHVLATGLTTQTTGAVNPGEQGALLGLEHSLFSLARIGGPPLGTGILGHLGDMLVVEGSCGAFDILSIVVLIMFTSSTRTKAPSKLS